MHYIFLQICLTYLSVAGFGDIAVAIMRSETKYVKKFNTTPPEDQFSPKPAPSCRFCLPKFCSGKDQ